MRRLSLALVLLASLSGLASAPALAAGAEPAPALAGPVLSDEVLEHLKALSQDLPANPASCCKVCRKGKPCGDSCISQNYSCHKAPGCAC